MDEIYRTLEELKPGTDFRSSKNYLDDLLLESMDIIDLVSVLEETYGFKFDIKDLVPETFVNAESLWQVVQKYKQVS